MSKRMMTKISAFSLGFALTLAISINVTPSIFTSQADLLASCMAIESNLPVNHSSHPCQASHMANKSWFSWLSHDSQSAHLHYLDLVELLHYSFH